VILWIDDANGNIGQVDVTTQSVVAGSVHSTGLGPSLTDIGFIGSNLFGTTFTNLYSINSATGASTNIGSYGGVGASDMNALVGNGTGLLGASNATDEVYSINRTSAAATNFDPSPAPLAGDLAFAGTTLYESAVGPTGADELVNVSTDSVVNTFTSGATTFTSVFGLADDGTTMYAVNGTNVYSVNLANADLTFLFDYAGQGLAAANGTAFMNEGRSAVPEPASLALFGAGLGALLMLRRRSRTLAS